MRLEKLGGIKHGFTSLWESVADSWQGCANPPLVSHAVPAGPCR